MDRITAEVRRVREQIFERYGNDPERFGRHLAELEEKYRKTGRFKFATPKREPALREEPPKQ